MNAVSEAAGIEIEIDQGRRFARRPGKDAGGRGETQARESEERQRRQRRAKSTPPRPGTTAPPAPRRARRTLRRRSFRRTSGSRTPCRRPRPAGATPAPRAANVGRETAAAANSGSDDERQQRHPHPGPRQPPDIKRIERLVERRSTQAVVTLAEVSGSRGALIASAPSGSGRRPRPPLRDGRTGPSSRAGTTASAAATEAPRRRRSRAEHGVDLRPPRVEVLKPRRRSALDNGRRSTARSARRRTGRRSGPADRAQASRRR